MNEDKKGKDSSNGLSQTKKKAGSGQATPASRPSTPNTLKRKPDDKRCVVASRFYFNDGINETNGSSDSRAADATASPQMKNKRRADSPPSTETNKKVM
jgi:transglutaminase/protease-like cytokinesis protein 3